ncbi:MAG: YCF48-related protein [Thermoleophilia bacterium]
MGVMRGRRKTALGHTRCRPLTAATSGEDAGRIMATKDGGRQWTVQVARADRVLTDIAFVDARSGWAVGRGGALLSSMNGGRSWVQRAVSGAPNIDAVTFVDRSIGWVVADHKVVLAMADGGTHWSRVDFGSATGYLEGIDCAGAGVPSF